MTEPTQGLREEIEAWFRSLLWHSENTLRSYRASLESFAASVEGVDPHDIGRRHVEAWLAGLHAEGKKPSTLASRLKAVKVFYRWLVGEDPSYTDPTARVKAPRIPTDPVPILSTDEIRRLLATCSGTGFEDRRDAAILHLFLGTGVRLAELTNLRLDDVDIAEGVIVVTGKGSKVRGVPFDPRTRTVLDRYLMRARRGHPHARLPWLWLGEKGQMTDSGIAKMVARRASEAGLRVHSHMFRHTVAHRFLASGHAEGDLMRILGWSSRRMLDRYGASGADARARKAYRGWDPFSE